MHYLVDKDQLLKLGKYASNSSYFQFRPADKHETRANTNANWHFSNTAFVTVN